MLQVMSQSSEQPFLDVCPPPAIFDLGYQQVKVEVMDKIDEEGKLAGEFDTGTGTIKLVRDLSPRDALRTLLHETMHAAAWYGSAFPGAIEDSEVAEEHVVHVLGNGVVEVLIRNPDYLLWVNSAVAAITPLVISYKPVMEFDFSLPGVTISDCAGGTGGNKS